VKGCDIDSDNRSGFDEALQAAAGADLIVLAIGEHKDMSGEAASKAMIRIPGVQEALLEALSNTGKPVVTIVMNGRPLVLSKVHEKSAAVLEAWWLGTQAGNALADILFGDYNPSGKLPISFPMHEGQIPVFYSHKNTGRPFDPSSKWNTKYLDLPNDPLYAFGYGLSYTTFSYSLPRADRTDFSGSQSVSISVDVKNTGNYDGEEVVQLYVRDLVGSVTRPVKELKGFRKIFLKKGESKTVSFTLTPADLAFYDRNMHWVTEPGEFDIFVGSDSNTQNKIRIRYSK
jgi:beta-glucosidase